MSIPRQLTSEKILSINKKIKLIDEFNKTIHEWDLNEKIVGQCLCKMYIVVCTEKVILVYDQVTFEEVKKDYLDLIREYGEPTDMTGGFVDAEQMIKVVLMI